MSAGPAVASQWGAEVGAERASALRVALERPPVDEGEHAVGGDGTHAGRDAVQARQQEDLLEARTDARGGEACPRALRGDAGDEREADGRERRESRGGAGGGLHEAEATAGVPTCARSGLEFPFRHGPRSVEGVIRVQ